MNDVEARVRDSLRRLAGEPGVRTMPPGTLKRVRRRQAGVTSGVAGLAIMAILAGTTLLRALPHGEAPQPARPAETDETPSHPLEAVPDSWPQIDISNARDANIDVVGGEPANERVIASGTVAGSAFSFVGRTDGGVGCRDSPAVELAGPAPIGQSPAAAVITSGCAADRGPHPVPARADLRLFGQGEGSVPELEASYGFVSERVARLEVTLGNTTSVEIPILNGLRGWDVRTFLAFPPQDRSGYLVAYDSQGRALARSRLCMHEGISNSCRNPTEQLIPVRSGTTADPRVGD